MGRSAGSGGGRQIGSECLITPNTRPSRLTAPRLAYSGVVALFSGKRMVRHGRAVSTARFFSWPWTGRLGDASSGWLVRQRQNWNICAQIRPGAVQASGVKQSAIRSLTLHSSRNTLLRPPGCSDRAHSADMARSPATAVTGRPGQVWSSGMARPANVSR
jgi:hypothetical protein